MPLSMSKITRSQLQPVIKRIDRRLPGWMPRMLASGGRLQMVNAVLSAIPNYFMSCIAWDKSSTDMVDKLTRAFLWKNQQQVLGGQCLVAWDIVTMPKEQGGLGVRNLQKHNQALMANLATKLLSGGDGPCFGWLARWYLGQQIPVSASPQDTPFWKSLVKLIPLVQATTTCTLASGKSVAFWSDSWSAMGQLKEVFPILYTFATDQICSVASQLQNGGWVVDLHSPLSHMAEAQLAALLEGLQDMATQLNDGKDARKLVTTGKTPTTADYYKLLSDRGMRWQPHGWIWIKAIPHRHKFFLWLAYRSRLNTRDNMIKKKWGQDGGCDRCPAVESIHHITLHCRYTHWIWDRWGITSEACHSQTISCFVQSVQTTLQKMQREVWPICFAAGMLNLWKMRNALVFNKQTISRQQLLKQVAYDLKLWAHRDPKLEAELNRWAEGVNLAPSLESTPSNSNRNGYIERERGKDRLLVSTEWISSSAAAASVTAASDAAASFEGSWRW
jgi:hypothetical protein